MWRTILNVLDFGCMFGILDFFNIPGVNPASDKEVSAILFTITRGIADTSVEEEIKKKSNFSDDNIFHNTAEYLNLIKRTYMTYVAMRISALWAFCVCMIANCMEFYIGNIQKNRKCKFPSRVLNYGLVLFYNNRSKVTCTTISDKMITCNFKLHLYSYIVQFSKWSWRNQM